MKLLKRTQDQIIHPTNQISGYVFCTVLLCNGMPVYLLQLYTLAYPEGDLGGRVQSPIESSEFFLNCVFAKYTVHALLTYSLNPKFSTGKC